MGKDSLSDLEAQVLRILLEDGFSVQPDTKISTLKIEDGGWIMLGKEFRVKLGAELPLGYQLGLKTVRDLVLFINKTAKAIHD